MAPAKALESIEATIDLINRNLRSIPNIKYTISRLDFYSGQPGDDGERFIQPFPHSKMLQRLNETRPWDNPRICPSISPTDQRLALDYCAEARGMWNVLQSYLKLNQDDAAAGVYEDTRWKSIEDKNLARLTIFLPWKVESFMDTMDYEKPHMICFLSNHLPLEDMIPSKAELQAILWIIGSRIIYVQYQHHRIIPITLISGAGFRLRITQGYLDQGQLRIRMTPIVDFSEGEKDNWDDFFQALCWIAGDPIGVTT
ncbi:hypothetical protein GGR52DRAFT_571026 [Hypoxylon sp. FL1284]|nr:hypothetical protein GGR52DRAFT_571026 [Hypoxylon sp. FL1284]